MRTNPNDFVHIATLSKEPLTKREYFAALALQGATVNPDAMDPQELAKYAVQCANELIEALNAE